MEGDPMRNLIIAGILGIIVISSGCESQESDTKDIKMLTITEKDNGKNFSVKPEQAFKVVLKSNPTTGYSWTVKDINEKVVKLEKSDYLCPDSKMVGVGGKQIFLFKVANEGQDKTTLKLVYQRPWLKHRKPEKVFAFDVIISK